MTSIINNSIKFTINFREKNKDEISFEYKNLKNGFIFFRFNPTLIIGNYESKNSVFNCSHIKDHYIFKKLFENPCNLIFNRNKNLIKKEKFYIKCLELGFNCFEIKKPLNFNREKNKNGNDFKFLNF